MNSYTTYAKLLFEPVENFSTRFARSKNKKILRKSCSYDVIIVNFNGQEIISRCLESVYKSSVLPKSVIIVDNASRDDSVSFIRDKFPRVKVIESKENLGFGRGNNLGMLHSKAEYILFLNSDVILDGNCAKKLLEGFEKDDIAVLDPIIYKGWKKTKNQPLYAFGAELNESGFAYGLYDQSNSRQNLNNFSAACCMARADVFKEIGFEKNFFLYYEEPILSVNLLKRGLKIGRIKEAVCYHLESFSSPEKAAGGVAFRQFYGVQNRHFMLGKHWPFLLLLKVLPLNFFHFIYVLFFSLAHGKFASLKLIYLVPANLIKGIQDRDRTNPVDKKWFKKLKRTPLLGYLSLKKRVFSSAGE